MCYDNYDDWKLDNEEEQENECGYCGEPCEKEFCSRSCEKAYEND